MRTPDRRILVTELSIAAVELAVAALAPLIPDAPGIHGPPESAAEFARCWTALRGREFQVANSIRAYQLTELRPAYAPGSPRLGTAADLELCLRWTDEFATEIAELPFTPKRPEASGIRLS